VSFEGNYHAALKRIVALELERDELARCLDGDVDCATDRVNLRVALADLHRQVSKFCEEQGEAEFYTGNAMAALGLSDNPVHLQTLADLWSARTSKGVT
jgi:hypothetical protein